MWIQTFFKITFVLQFQCIGIIFQMTKYKKVFGIRRFQNCRSARFTVCDQLQFRNFVYILFENANFT